MCLQVQELSEAQELKGYIPVLTCELTKASKPQHFNAILDISLSMWQTFRGIALTVEVAINALEEYSHKLGHNPIGQVIGCR